MSSCLATARARRRAKSVRAPSARRRVRGRPRAPPRVVKRRPMTEATLIPTPGRPTPARAALGPATPPKTRSAAVRPEARAAARARTAQGAAPASRRAEARATMDVIQWIRVVPGNRRAVLRAIQTAVVAIPQTPIVLGNRPVVVRPIPTAVAAPAPTAGRWIRAADQDARSLVIRLRATTVAEAELGGRGGGQTDGDTYRRRAWRYHAQINSFESVVRVWSSCGMQRRRVRRRQGRLHGSGDRR